MFWARAKNEAKARAIAFLSLSRWRNTHKSLNEKILQILLSDRKFVALNNAEYIQRSTQNTWRQFCEPLVFFNFVVEIQNLADDTLLW